MCFYNYMINIGLLVLRNKFNFWNVHGIMNASGHLQSKKGFMLTLQETRSIHHSMNIPKIEFLLIFTFYYKYPKYKKYF